AWKQVTARHGVQFTEERFYELGGVPSRHILAMLRDEQRLGIDPLAVAKEKENAYLELLHHVGPIEQIVAIAFRWLWPPAALAMSSNQSWSTCASGTGSTPSSPARMSSIRNRRPTSFWKPPGASASRPSSAGHTRTRTWA